jgi:hypothetical protein
MGVKVEVEHYFVAFLKELVEFGFDGVDWLAK